MGSEIKYSDAPRLTPSMKIAMRELKLHRLSVLYPGERSYPLADRIQVISAQKYLSEPVTTKKEILAADGEQFST